MSEPFKNLIDAQLVRDAAAVLRRADPAFDAERFTRLASHGLQALEMKARAMQIADALQATLHTDFARAADVLEAALAPAETGETMAKLQGLSAGLRGWILWPVGEYIARQGQATPERALAALHGITQRFTAEFAIRPFIVKHPDVVWPTLQRWCSDDSAHVRRLVSEGSRPRLPWGLQLRGLVQDPSPTLPLLLALQDDPSDYVRRSVANHLNDIAKDHPGVVAHWLQTHLPNAPAARQTLLRHASRTLIKQGHPQVLKAWGLGTALRGQASLTLSTSQLVLGQDLGLTLHLQSHSAKAQTLAIDYAVFHVKANGSTSPKVFKGWKLVLPAQGTLTLAKRHPVRPITTRRYHAGTHRVVVQANGKAVAEASFDLRLPAG